MTDEAGMAGLLCVRLRVVNRKITEVEALITRKETANSFTRPDGLSDPKIAQGLAAFFEDVPESERESRKDLIAQTDLYFAESSWNTAGTIKTVDVPGVGKVKETPSRSAALQRRGGRNFQDQERPDRLDRGGDDRSALRRHVWLAVEICAR